jgi:SAM-dependent methyltransferase
LTSSAPPPREFSAVAHEDILLWNPLPEAAALRVVDGLRLTPASRVLDVGCGRAELLIRLLARTGARGVGVDPWAHAIATARASASGRVDATRLDLRETRYDPAAFDDASVDVVVCTGATHALGGLRPALQEIRRILAPGGTALVGEGHWMREPDPEYLTFLDARPDELLDHAGNLAAARDAGFDVDAIVSTPDDLDRYEDRYAANVERFAVEHPDHPDVDAYLARIRAWRAAYLRWGRTTLGFALYVLRPSAG